MAIEKKIDQLLEELSKLPTKESKLEHIDSYIFSIKKFKIEFEETDLPELERLKIKTENDFKKYHDEFDKGNFILFDSRMNPINEKRLKMDNINLLERRIHLENLYQKFSSDIKLLDELKIQIQNLNDEPIDWISIYNDLNIEMNIEPDIYITNSITQKKNYFSKASFKLTIEYLIEFKKKVYLLPERSLKEFLIEFKIPKPVYGNSKSNLFNQTVYEAQLNYYEFIQSFKKKFIPFFESFDNEPEESKIYLIKDGKFVASEWEFFKTIGMVDSLAKKGITLNPTHNYELLKETRIGLFENEKKKFIEERKIKKVSTTDFELNSMYFSWLKSELTTIENWLSDKYPNGKPKHKPSTSDQIEILKYQRFVREEMTKAEQEINSGNQSEEIPNQKPTKKFIANEYALAYVFDLYSNNKQIPINPIDGGYSKIELKIIGNELYDFDKEKDTFYRAVKYVIQFDLNNKKHLENISKRWYESVKKLSKNWNKTEVYLNEKGLTGD